MNSIASFSNSSVTALKTISSSTSPYSCARIFLIRLAFYNFSDSLDEIINQYDTLDKKNVYKWACKLRSAVNERINPTLATRLAQVVKAELQRIYKKPFSVGVERTEEGETLCMILDDKIFNLSGYPYEHAQFNKIKIDGGEYEVNGSITKQGKGSVIQMADGSVKDNTYDNEESLGFYSKNLILGIGLTDEIALAVEYEIESLSIKGYGILEYRPIFLGDHTYLIHPVEDN